MSTLELLPMWGGAEPDVDLFFSGTVNDDDGEWAGGESVDAAPEEAGSSLLLYPSEAHIANLLYLGHMYDRMPCQGLKPEGSDSQATTFFKAND